jgi:Domain of unknown function (DUF1707)
MSRNGHLRASDADRDQVAERLRNAAAEGRIATDEFEQRLGATLGARTYGELAAVVADLPGTPVRRRSSLPFSPIARVAIALAILIPVMMAMIFVLTGIVAGWMLWAIAGWWFFGHRHRRHGGQGRHSHDGGGPRQVQRQAGAGPARGFWG